VKKTVRYFEVYWGCLLALSPMAAMAASPDLQQGTKSVAFAVFPQDRGAGINGKVFLNDNTALIGDLTLLYGKTENNLENQTAQTKSNSISIAGGFRKYLYTGEVSFFSDTELFLRYGKTKSDSQINSSTSSSDSTTRSAGLTVDFGAEYFFSSQVSLSATMGLQYSYSRTKSNTESSGGSTSSSNSKTWSFDTVQTAVLLNYYW
jgi:hypothetical protein